MKVRTEQPSATARAESPDEVCQRESKSPPKLTVRLSAEESPVTGYVLIEGSPKALRFLASLLGAQARAKDCGSQLHPNGPGNIFFSRKSELGIYIHRLPCASRPTKHRKH